MTASETTIEALPKSTVRLIGSAQVITSVTSVVKELVENSLDAEATSIEVKLENYGLDKVDVRDNGRGIKRSDTAVMGLPHYTSKITDTQDLSHLATYGFRGEALGSLCAVSRVCVTTKTSEDDVSMTYDLGPDGAVTDQKPSHLGQGTTVLASQLFHSVPVRRQYYSSTKRRKEELKRVEDLIIAFSVIKHDVRFALRHNREVVWQKNVVPSVRHGLMRVFGSTALSHMVHKEVKHVDPECEIELYVPRPDADSQLVTRSAPDRCFIFVNHRPVSHTDISKLLRQGYSAASGCETSRWPLVCVSVIVPAGSVDVNLEPNKTKVLLQENTEVLSVLTELLEEVYGKKEDIEKQVTEEKQDKEVEDFDKENRNNSEVIASTSKPGNDSTADSDFTLGLSKDMTSDLTFQHVKDVTSDLTFQQVKANKSDLILPKVKDVNSDMTLSKANNVTSDLTLSEVKDVTSELTSPKVKDSDVTLPLTRPLHNSTRVDLTDDPVCTQNVTFDLLKDFEDDDDLFKGLQETKTIVKEMTNVAVSETIGCRLTPKAGEQRSRIAPVSSSLVESNTTGPTLPRMDLDMLDAGDVSTAGSTSVRSAALGEAGPGQSSASGSEGAKDGEKTGPSGSEWSRGQGVKDRSGDTVQPVQLLLPRSSFASLNTSSSPGGNTSSSMHQTDLFSSPQARMERAANSPGQMKLTDVTNNSHVKKPTTAFIYFSKEVRPKVVEENPDADFQAIARLIGQRWTLLSETERDKYEKMMTKDVQRYREQVAATKDHGRSPSLNRTNRKRKMELGQSVMDMLRSPKVERPAKKPRLIRRTTITLDFSMAKLKRNMTDGDKYWRPSDESLPAVVGEVRTAGWWVGTQAGHVVGIVPWRLQETLIYAQLMEQHSLPTDKLPEPIPLSPSAVGGDASWQALLAMSSMRSYQTDSTYSYVTDPRVTRSGFSIRKTQETSPRVEVVSMTTAVNHFGLSDLQEVLAKVRDQPSVTVTEGRPAKVKLYLQSEAVRMARQMPQRFTAEEIRDLLRRRTKRLSPDDNNCFHNRPFLRRLYDLSDVPLSQESEAGSTD